ncbi:NAD(P)-dependent oxidoreductase [Croceicoccus mobilis]|uniref:Dehydrogenase n=1 Tax=Croceicoccus mobilis TaxID=1703339 RepID=A0A916Z3L8_9SPHN|nr:DUF1932 domain-containing protein [Croceicoccus mobilis]GGD75309.1 dehydrogenase [Croceicoccus mobilis]
MAPAHTLIGFGEAASTFAAAGGWATPVRAFDIDLERGKAIRAAGLEAARDAGEAVRGSSLVLSLVTADQAVCAAESAAPHLAPGAIWCDMNSLAPSTKQRVAHAVEAAGARYVDAAILAPVQPAALAVPILLAGPAAMEAQVHLKRIGFANIRVVGDQIGMASTIKLCRSIAVKGIEAICAEMAITATKAGVLDQVLASLDASEKALSWAERVDYNLDRMLVHGRRRAAEMHEAGKMARDLGIAPLVTYGTAQWQQGLGELGLEPPPALAAKLSAIIQSREFKGEL